jgi:hypothetical protein
MTTESKKQNAKSSNSYVRTFRRRAIAANVFRRQGPAGLEYFDFTLSRSWKAKQTGKEGYSSCFFDRNVDDLMAAIGDAVDFIRAQMLEDIDSVSQSPLAELTDNTHLATDN